MRRRRRAAAVARRRQQPRRDDPSMSRNLATVLTDTAAEHGDQIAIKLDDAELPYKFLDGASAHVAGLLKAKGVEPGDRVGVMLPNVPYFPGVYYGILRLGAVVVPMNPLLKAREIEFYLKGSGAKVMFAWHDFGEAAEKGASDTGAEAIVVKPGEFEDVVGSADAITEVAERDGEDTAVILYTSGTTGTPKGAELTHDNLLSNVEAILETVIQIRDDDVVLG